MEELRKFVEECKKRLDELFPQATTNEQLRSTDYGVKLTVEKDNLIFGIFAGKQPDIPTIGYGSLCSGDTTRFEHVIFLDYDWINEWMVREELAYLVDKYRLSNFYLFYTRRFEYPQGGPFDRWYGNYQAVCCTKLQFKEVLKIIEETHCDWNYKTMPHYSRYKFWFLRFIDKGEVEPPKFFELIPDKPINMDRRVSQAHVRFLETWYGVPKLPYQNLDGSKEILMSRYMTAKR